MPTMLNCPDMGSIDHRSSLSPIANPSRLLNAAISMLSHIGKNSIADKIKNAWLRTIEDGYHTADIYVEGISRKKTSTIEFADAIIDRLGLRPESLAPSKLSLGSGKISLPSYKRRTEEKQLVGVDVFIDWSGSNPKEIGTALNKINAYKLKLKMITNRGVKVFPGGLEETFCTDHWRCRFVQSSAEIKLNETVYKEVEYEQVIGLLSKLYHLGFDVIKTENLYEFNGQRGFSLGQGE